MYILSKNYFQHKIPFIKKNYQNFDIECLYISKICW